MIRRRSVMKKNTNNVRNTAGRPAMSASQKRGYENAKRFYKEHVEAMKILANDGDRTSEDGVSST